MTLNVNAEDTHIGDKVKAYIEYTDDNGDVKSGMLNIYDNGVLIDTVYLVMSSDTSININDILDVEYGDIVTITGQLVDAYGEGIAGMDLEITT